MKNNIHLVALIGIAAVLLSSCSTKYAQRGGWPDVYGYSDTPLDSTTYQVTFAGNSATAPDLVDRYALYRAAELTAAKGFDYFVVLDVQREQNTTTSSMPNGHETHIEHDIDPQTGQLVPVAVTTSDYMTTTQTDHTVTKTIRMFKGVRPPDNSNAYDAKSMLRVMGPTIIR